MSALSIFFALLLDRLVGELPGHQHPLVGFGKLADKLEKYFLRDPELDDDKKKLLGVISCIILIVPLVSFVAFIMHYSAYTFGYALLSNVVLLYLVIGASSLEDHALEVKHSLESENMVKARLDLSHIVSRNTEELDDTAISRATIESVLENGSDAIFAPLFWFIIAGIPGALCYRLINTLDAMWGYRNIRYLYFGWAAAKLDDLVNWIPARLTAVTYALMGNFKYACSAWREHAPFMESPNAGPVMCSGAGSLNLTLGGPAIYHDVLKEKPEFGYGPVPGHNDIARATELVRRSTLFWLLIILLTNLFS